MDSKANLWHIDLTLEKISALAESIEVACPLYVDDRDTMKSVSKIRALAELVEEQVEALRKEIDKLEVM